MAARRTASRVPSQLPTDVYGFTGRDAELSTLDALVTRAATVRVLAASRESLRVAREQVWQVPPLDVTAGAESAAVELFVQHARSVYPPFALDDSAQTLARDDGQIRSLRELVDRIQLLDAVGCFGEGEVRAEEDLAAPVGAQVALPTRG